MQENKLPNDTYVQLIPHVQVVGKKSTYPLMRVVVNSANITFYININMYFSSILLNKTFTQHLTSPEFTTTPSVDLMTTFCQNSFSAIDKRIDNSQIKVVI